MHNRYEQTTAPVRTYFVGGLSFKILERVWCIALWRIVTDNLLDQADVCWAFDVV